MASPPVRTLLRTSAPTETLRRRLIRTLLRSIPVKNLLRSLLRRVLLHDPLGVHPTETTARRAKDLHHCESNRRACHLECAKLGGWQKGGFPKGWFWRMLPRNETGCPPGTKTGTRVLSHVPPERKPERPWASFKPIFSIEGYLYFLRLFQKVLEKYPLNKLSNNLLRLVSISEVLFSLVRLFPKNNWGCSNDPWL